MIKALYISYDGVLEPLGQSQIIPYLKELTKRGIRFVLLTFEKKHYLDKKRAQELYDSFKKNNIKWLKLRYHKKPPVLSTVFDIIQGLIVCVTVVKRERINVVHARSYVPSLIALLLKKIFRIKFIFDMRGFWADERIEGKLWKRKNILYHFVKFLETVFFRNADEIVVLTERAKTIIKMWGYNTFNVSVIPCCVDTDNFKFDNAFHNELRKRYNLDGRFVFVHTGSLEYWYMKEEMFKFFKAAKTIIPNAHFLILTYSDKKGISRLILDKGLDEEDFTILTVPFNDMPKYLSMVDAGLFFITPVFSKLASSPTKFAEYLSCGLPVIINNKIGDLEDYVLKNDVGVIIRDFDYDEYRQTFEILLNLLKDENLKFRCRKVACDNFSLDTGVDRYYQIYSRLR